MVIVWIIFVIALLILCFMLPSGGGSWVKRDGTIIEWDGEGNSWKLDPDGTLHEYLNDGH